MPHTQSRAKQRERAKRKQYFKNRLAKGSLVLERGTFKHKPTVRIPDPTVWGVPLRSNWKIKKREVAIMFKNRIREKRKEMGLSLTQLACRIGIAESNLSNLELGKWEPWPKVKRDLATALNTTEEVLFITERQDIINKLKNLVARR